MQRHKFESNEFSIIFSLGIGFFRSKLYIFITNPGELCTAIISPKSGTFLETKRKTYQNPHWLPLYSANLLQIGCGVSLVLKFIPSTVVNSHLLQEYSGKIHLNIKTMYTAVIYHKFQNSLCWLTSQCITLFGRYRLYHLSHNNHMHQSDTDFLSY